MLTDRVAFGPFDGAQGRPFAIDVKAGEIRRDGVIVPLQDLPFRLLTVLLERPGELVTRAELIERLWGSETFVDSAAGLNTAVAKLRDALGDNAEQPLYIETVPKRGYRFVGAISDVNVPHRRADPRVQPPLGGDRDELRLGSPKRQGRGGGGPATGAPIGEKADTSVRPYVSWPMMWIAAAVAVVVIAAVTTYRIRADRPETRVAVVLFDNETGRPEIGRLSQGLTDATVFALTAQPKLVVIGNAAILRTSRPFRDIAAVRDALHADFIVIGQVQLVDDQILVRSHLIRAVDQAHVWVGVSRMTDSEASLQTEVAGQIAEAVGSRAR
jgi:DNA-binding winged helix-turn-helix (wHTH) protein/TolB-like protein